MGALVRSGPEDALLNLSAALFCRISSSWIYVITITQEIQKNKENEDLVQINREKLWEKSIYRSPTQWCMARIHHIL